MVIPIGIPTQARLPTQHLSSSGKLLQKIVNSFLQKGSLVLNVTQSVGAGLPSTVGYDDGASVGLVVGPSYIGLPVGDVVGDTVGPSVGDPVGVSSIGGGGDNEPESSIPVINSNPSPSFCVACEK